MKLIPVFSFQHLRKRLNVLYLCSLSAGRCCLFLSGYLALEPHRNGYRWGFLI